MKTLTKIAEFVQSRDLEHIPPDRLDRLKRHVVDTWAAQMAGARIDAGTAVGQLFTSTDDTLSAIVTRCAQARCTEIDDIHLTSCTTPGAVVVSTALALANRRASRARNSSASLAGSRGASPAGSRSRSASLSGERVVSDRHETITTRAFCAAVLAGYEAMIRLGRAIDGPTALNRGVWPTAFAAAFGSAAVAARMMTLSVDQTAGALATAIGFAQQRAMASSPARSSRWLSLGVAAANGVVAAHAARTGLVGTADVDAWSATLTRGLGRRFLFDDIGMKPFPTARQGLAAVEGALGIVDRERLAPAEISAIVVALPERQRAIVDRAGFPQTRFDAIVNVRYQIALAIAAPGRLIDVVRTPPFDSPVVRRLMTRTRVARARDLDGRYPQAWPARVDIRAGNRRYIRVVLHPHGDARRPLTWSELAAKATAIAAPTAGASAIERLINHWRDAAADAVMPLFP